MKNIIKSIGELLIKFFKHYNVQDDNVKIPKQLKKMGTKIARLHLFITVVTLSFAFLLKVANIMIELKLILLGIILYMLYRGKSVIEEGFRLYEDSEREQFTLIVDNEVMLKGADIVGKTTKKVLKYDQNEKIFKLMTNESIINTVKNYLKNYWLLCINHKIDILEFISTILMLCFAIITNKEISQIIFIPVIFVFSIICFISSAYIAINREEFYKKDRDYRNEQALLINDMLRVSTIVPNDFKMRKEKIEKSILKTNRNIINFKFKVKKSKLIDSGFGVLSQWIIIIFYILAVDWNSINLETISEITANLAIVETALSHISKMAEKINRHNEVLTIINEEEKDMLLILNAYNNSQSLPKKIENINLKPFSIRYIEESENDKPFTLVSNNDINIFSGEIAVLYGPSGSGKSTFMKMLTEQIRIEKSTDIPSTSRFLFYDEKLRFGSLSIFEELFCCDEKPDLEKMQKILENLHLWTEIKFNCFDVWQWMKEKKFDHALSNGQKQRLILAKMLYWLNDDIDVMVLDECTSGLDDKVDSDSADAQKILEYIIRYCNIDKKRIIIIATHQDIDGVKEDLSSKYNFRNMHFISKNDYNYIKEL